MITGAHAVIYTNDVEADKAFFRDVLKLANIDVGHGWLIFKLPPSELAFHPAETSGRHELFLMCDDINAFIADVSEHGIACGEIQQTGWGILTSVTLPGGGKVGVYQPRHERPA